MCQTTPVATTAPTGIYAGVSADERRAERRERLLDAGLELLGTEGWQATTVRGVCEQARLNPRYFYESFPSLDDLLIAVFDRITEEATNAVVAAVAANAGDVRGTARAAIGSFVDLMTTDPRKGQVAFIEAMGSPALMRRRLDTLQQFADLVVSWGREEYGPGADEETAQLTAQVLVGGLAEALIAWLEGRLKVSREKLVDRCTELFLAAATVAERAER
jgi:AcrR family transcriptional regulator